MVIAGAFYSAYGGGAYYLMVLLAAAGLVGVAALHGISIERRNQ
jgi:hypothetical protein